MQKIPNRISKVLVVVVYAACGVGVGSFLYARHVLKEPMVIIRDSEGVLRWKTRLEDVQERLAEAEKKLNENPEDKQRKFLYGIALRNLQIEQAKGAKVGEPATKDEDLR